MEIIYDSSRQITEAEFVDLLERSTLAQRRPVGNPEEIRSMLQHANLLCTAWHGAKLVGVARSLTDFSYCCYLSDLAVDVSYQKMGIGRALMRLTQTSLGENAKIILLAAPAAENYYPHLGLEPHRSAWILPANPPLK